MTKRSAIYNAAARDYRAAHAAYRDYLEAHMAAAEEATNGRMVSKAGLAAGVCAWDLLTGPGVYLRAMAYATDELREWWESHPRLTFERFERQWLTNAADSTPGVYLSRKQFAERIGVKPDTLNRYTLPEPDVYVGELRGWLADTVDAWQAARSPKRNTGR